MPNLSPRESAEVISAVATANQLLQLDEIWTREATSLSLVPDLSTEDARLDELESVVGAMTALLEVWSGHASVLTDLRNNYADDLEEVINSLAWGELLGPSDREDLRWFLRPGGYQSSLFDLDSLQTQRTSLEIKALQDQMNGLRHGSAAAGDLSKAFRCGTASGMLTGGALLIPTGVAGGVILSASAAVLSVATGGIGVVVVVSALWWARRHHC
jgi:hypothetical protein